MAHQQVELGLDEASIFINKTAARKSLAGDSLLVLYQIDECYGCPLDVLKKIEENNDQSQIVLGTKYLIDLEIRRIRQRHPHEDSSSLVCNFAKLSLRDHARYRIDIREIGDQTIGVVNKSSSGASGNFDCSLHTIDEGQCSYCPLALIFFVLLLVTAAEKLYTKFVGRQSSRSSHPDVTTHNSRRTTKLSSVTILSGQKDIKATGNNEPVPGYNDNLDNGQTEGSPVAPPRDGGASSRSQMEESSQMVTIQGSTPEVANNTGRRRSSGVEIGGADIDNTSGVSNETAISKDQLDNNNNNNNNKTTKQRIESLDAFRGFTIAGMIVVNYGGAGYKQLEHQAWDGLTLADLVFPFFIFSMGASIAISIKSLMKKGKRLQEIFVKIIRRTIILMLLGLCLNSKWLNIQQQGLDELRLTGVLQRFSISYLIVASMYAVKLSVINWTKEQSIYRNQLVSRLIGIIFEYLTALNYLAVYLYVTFFFNYSDTCPIGYLGPGGMTENGIYANCTGGAAAWLDRTVLGAKHLYHDREVMQIFKTKQSHDPEGLLGNTTSILLTLIGLQCGKILAQSHKTRTNNTNRHKARLQSFIRWSIIMGLISISAIFIPINKRLWSLPFISVTALCAFLMMTLLYILLDVYNCQRTFVLLKLLVSAGKNPIFLYVGHSLLNGMLPWHFYVDESSHLQLLLRLSWSLICWLLIANYMATKRIFIRI